MGATEIYTEYESGTVASRPELEKMMNHVKEGDTIAVTEVSRITRSVKQLCEIIEMAKERRIRFIIGTFVVDCTGELDCMTEGMLKMMAVFAEIERNLIISRVKSGIRNARAKGIRLGRPTLSAANLPKAVVEKFPVWKAGYINKKEYASICEVSRPTLDKYIALLTDK
jgi:DNA invertase Pin-like site-specific DNA recombinase